MTEKLTAEEYENLAKFKRLGGIGDSFWYLGSKFYITHFMHNSMYARYMHSAGLGSAQFFQSDIKALYTENDISDNISGSIDGITNNNTNLDLENLLDYAGIAKNVIKEKCPHNDLLVSKLDYFIERVKNVYRKT